MKLAWRYKVLREGYEKVSGKATNLLWERSIHIRFWMFGKAFRTNLSKPSREVSLLYLRNKEVVWGRICFFIFFSATYLLPVVFWCFCSWYRWSLVSIVRIIYSLESYTSFYSLLSIGLGIFGTVFCAFSSISTWCSWFVDKDSLYSKIGWLPTL